MSYCFLIEGVTAEGLWTFKTGSNRDALNGKEGLEPIDQYYIRNAAGKYGEYYLYYFGKEEVKEWEFRLPDEALERSMQFKVDLIDTWNMRITPVEQIFEIEQLDRYEYIDKNRSKIKLPGKPYMALRIRRVR